MALVGSRGTEDALEFQAGNDIGLVHIVIDIQTGRIEDLVARCQHHGAHFHLGPAGLLVIPDGFGQADLFTEAAADADVAVNDKTSWNCLGILHVGGFAQIKTLVEFIDSRCRAYPTALSTGGALLQVYVARVIDKFSIKVAGLAFKIFHFRVGNQIDIEVPADFHQLGGNNTHSTIICWKRLV